MFKKILIGSTISIAIIVAALVAIPYFFKDDIVKFTQQQINDNINAYVSFNDVNLSLIKSFPNLQVGLENLQVVGKETFKGVKLADVKSFDITVNLAALWKNYKDAKGTIRPKLKP